MSTFQGFKYELNVKNPSSQEEGRVIIVLCEKHNDYVVSRKYF